MASPARTRPAVEQAEFGRALRRHREHLQRYEPRSSSDPLYVFTPRGEIFLMPAESTALDFSYHIHTQMGHHAMRIEVNGKPVPHGYQLSNGDIVRVHHYPNFAGPDISWLGLAKTPRAQVALKRGLRMRAGSAHEGRAYFKAALLKELNRFESARKYKLTVTSERVDGFLRESSKAEGYTELREFYAKINNDRDMTRRLVERLVSAEGVLGVVNGRDRHVTSAYEPGQVNICMLCRPAPGDSIAGVEGMSRRSKVHLTVHRAGKPHVHEMAAESAQVPLKWLGAATPDAPDLLVFNLQAADRRGPLREILEAALLDKVELLKVDAQKNGDAQADISLLLKGEWLGGFDKVSERLGEISGVQRITTSQPSPSQRIALSAGSTYVPAPPAPNPYTTEV